MGWKLTGADADVQEEYPVEDMAGVVGQMGYSDYVLFGKDGLPLAVGDEAHPAGSPIPAANRQHCMRTAWSGGRRPMMFTQTALKRISGMINPARSARSAACSARKTCKS